jgi:hypothetical protein
MPSEWSQFARQHWIIGGILVSLLWFFAGRQSLSNGRPDAAMFWQTVGAITILILCGWAIAERQWLGLAFGIAVFYIEARSIRHVYAETRKNQR